MEKSKRSEATLTTRMNHEDDHGMNGDSNLSQKACVHLNKENSQGSRNEVELLSLNEEKLIHTLACDEQLRRDQQLLHEQLLKQNWDLREAHEKSLNEIEELKRFQGSTFETIARRKIGRRSRYYFGTPGQNSGIAA